MAPLPNFLILFVDDLGFSEVNVPSAPFGYDGYGGRVATPHVDALAREGMLFTDWYSAWHVCSPSRAAMVTGRLPPRTGIDSVGGGVLAATAAGGLPTNETTFATLLGQQRGYATMAVGKWHLGQREQFLPTRHGFQEYYGIPFSADMGTSYWHPAGSAEFQPFPVPLLNGTTVVEQPAGLRTLAGRYADAAAEFITRQTAAAVPFLLYMSFNHVHNPQFCSERWCNSSTQGSPPGAAMPNPDAALHGAGIGASVQEMDAAVGAIMAAVEAAGADENTLVFFTSDNGAPSNHDAARMSNAPLKGFKGSIQEGGIRMPAIARWPGRIPAGSVSRALSMTTDIFATVAALADHAEEALPAGLVIDGRDLSDVLLGGGAAAGHECLFHYKTGAWLGAVRCGELKLMFDADGKPGDMYNLTADVGESRPLPTSGATYKAQAPVIAAARAAQIASVEPVVDQVNLGWDTEFGLCGFPHSKAAFPDSPNCTSDPSLWFPFGSPPPTPAPLPPAQPGAFQGCYWDKGYPTHGGEQPCDLPVVKRGGCPRYGESPRATTAEKMTLELCNTLCSGHGFFGVQNGGTGCFCGGAFGKYGRSGNCSMPCAGNASQTCGGPGANSVYAVNNATDSILMLGANDPVASR